MAPFQVPPTAPLPVSRARALILWRRALLLFGASEIGALALLALLLLATGGIDEDLPAAALHALGGALLVPGLAVVLTLRAEKTFLCRPSRRLLAWDFGAFLGGSLLLLAAIAVGRAPSAPPLRFAGDALVLSALLAITLWYTATWLTLPEDGTESFPHGTEPSSRS